MAVEGEWVRMDGRDGGQRGQDDGRGVSDRKLKSAIIIIPAFEPVVAGSGVAEEDLPDAFKVFDPVFNGDDEADRSAVADGERLAAHFVGEDRLRVEGTGRVDANIVQVVWRAHANVREGGIGLQVVVLNEVAEFYAAPPGDLAPAFNAFKLINDFGLWQPSQFIEGDLERGVVALGDLEHPFGRVEAVCAEAYSTVVPDVAGGGGRGEGRDQVIGGQGMFENPVVNLEAFAEDALDAVARYGIFDPEPGLPGSGAKNKEGGKGNKRAAVDLLLGS